MTEECLFCRIVRGEIPGEIVLDEEDVVAFRDVRPAAPTHVLVVPRSHIPSISVLDEADEPVIGALFGAARRIAEAEGVAGSGYRMVINAGSDAGQSVDHVHLHVLGGRHMAWPPG
ncbi:MAG: histidine triad nucleotide-binding protein [Longimicrobiales bacterium]